MRIEAAGRVVGLDRQGDGPTLVLLHAFPLDRRMWSALLAQLGPAVDAVSVDLPGFGDSELGDDAPSIDSFADAVEATLAALDIPRAVVCGLSMGGYVALAMADRHPERLAGLVLADTRAGADSDEQRAARDTGIGRVAREGAAGFVAELVPRLVAAQHTAARDEALAIAGLQSPLAVAGALAALRDRPDRSALLPQIHVPTTVIVGSQDTLTPPAEARRLAKAIPAAALVEIAGAGHLSAMEQPDAFAAAVTALLARAG